MSCRFESDSIIRVIDFSTDDLVRTLKALGILGSILEVARLTLLVTNPDPGNLFTRCHFFIFIIVPLKSGERKGKKKYFLLFFPFPQS